MKHLCFPDLNSNVFLERRPPAVVSAKRIGPNECRCEYAYSISTSSYAPVLTRCRELLRGGCGLNQAIEIYRADVLAVHVRSIGKTAKLAVEDSENGVPRSRLARLPRPGAASPTTFDLDAAISTKLGDAAPGSGAADFPALENLRRQIRDELADVERQIAAERSCTNA